MIITDNVHLAIDNTESLYSTIKTMINKPKTHCFGIDCHVFVFLAC